MEVKAVQLNSVKAASLVGSVIVSELKKKLTKKQNQNERLLNSLKYS